MRGPPRSLTDDELAAIVRWIARAWLEAERGQRTPAALRRFLAPHLAYGLDNADRVIGAPPVTATDIGTARFERIGRRKGYGVAVVREADGSWGALLVTLRRDRTAGWHVVEVSRPTPAPAPAGAVRTGGRGSEHAG